jgi:hypothetical protein
MTTSLLLMVPLLLPQPWQMHQIQRKGLSTAQYLG